MPFKKGQAWPMDIGSRHTQGVSNTSPRNSFARHFPKSSPIRTGGGYALDRPTVFNALSKLKASTCNGLPASQASLPTPSPLVQEVWDRQAASSQDTVVGYQGRI